MSRTARFEAFIPFILEWETEFYSRTDKQRAEGWVWNDDRLVRVERDPDDPGGTTKYGIDQRSHPNIPVERLTKENAIDIYSDEWVMSGSEHMPEKLGEAYFNVRVNAGSGRAQKCLTRSNGEPGSFLDHLSYFYKELAQSPRRRKYLKGWLNRTVALRAYLGLPTSKADEI